MADKITLNTLASIQNDPTAVALINANSAVIVAGMDNTLSRDGTSPNQMQAPIDMNGQPLINLPAPTTMDEPLRLADINSIISVIPTITVPGFIRYQFSNINFNTTNTDNLLTFTLPAGVSRYRINSLLITHASVALSTATAGLFTGAGGTGLGMAANQSLAGLTQTAENTTGNALALSLVSAGTTALNLTTLYLRIGTAQGVAATANVTLILSAH